jgi:hypothetical protein
MQLISFNQNCRVLLFDVLARTICAQPATHPPRHTHACARTCTRRQEINKRRTNLIDFLLFNKAFSAPLKGRP